MFAWFFHEWERRLASVSKDRVVRPFEWGLDWLPAEARSDAPAQAQVAAWVESVLREGSGFYDLPPTTEFALTPAAAEARASGDGGTLRFPSAFVTPHPENNTVVGRWFPVGGDAPGHVERAKGRAVLVMPQWNSDPGGHIGLAQLLARFGLSALRMSLPYHDDRMPPELTRADYIVSSNIVRTVQVCRQAVLDARRSIAWLADQGYTRIGILGTSLGSCLALLTAAHEPRVKAQALNHVSPWFSDVVWRGLSTVHVRRGLDGHIDADTLRDLWRPISPWTHLDKVRDTKTLLIYAKYDLTFPVDLSQTLIAEFRQRGIPHEVGVLPCGHYSTGSAPFKFLDAWMLTRFLLKSL